MASLSPFITYINDSLKNKKESNSIDTPMQAWQKAIVERCADNNVKARDLKHFIGCGETFAYKFLKCDGSLFGHNSRRRRSISDEQIIRVTAIMEKDVLDGIGLLLLAGINMDMSTKGGRKIYRALRIKPKMMKEYIEGVDVLDISDKVKKII